MEIIFFGTGSATCGVNRDNTYILIGSDDDYKFIDVGGNPLGKLKRNNIDIHKISEVIITHFHIDHFYGLPSLLWGMWIEGRTRELKIHCSTLDIEKLTALLEIIGVKSWPVSFAINIVPYEWTKECIISERGKLKICTFPSVHYIPTIGLKICFGNKQIIYSADSEVNKRINDENHIDLLIHEATSSSNSQKGHSSLREIIEYYSFDKIDRMVIVHLTDNEPYEEILSKFDGNLKNKIMIGKDHLKILIE